jgi:peptide/nickel transport system substrate-binding protein
MLHSDRRGNGNNGYYSNAEVDRLLDQALATPDQARRAPLYEQVARIGTEDAAALFVHNTKWYGPFRKNVQGVRFCPIGDGQEMRWLRIT